MGNRKWWVYILIFFVSQFAAVALPFGLKAVGIGISGSTFLSVALLMANLLAIVFFLLYRPAEVTWPATLSGLRGHNLRRTMLVFLLAIPTCLLVNLIQEAFFPDIPNLVGEETFKDLMYHPLGLITIAVIGPLSEELLFRGGVLTSIHQKYASQGPASAIAFSRRQRGSHDCSGRKHLRTGSPLQTNQSRRAPERDVKTSRADMFYIKKSVFSI